MHLAHKQMKRFYRILDSLIFFTNDTLHLVRNLLDPETKRISPEKRQEVLDALWENPQTINAFASHNPYGLSDEDIAVALSWRSSITDTFVVMEHRREYSIFMGGGNAFAVQGLAQDIEEIVPETPAMVKTTLLPFEDTIVFAAQCVCYPVNFASAVRDSFTEELGTHLEKGLIRTASEFIVASQAHQESLRLEEVEDMLRELEDSSAKGGVRPLPAGLHRGALAGTSAEERAKLIDAAEGGLTNSPFEMDWLAYLKEYATKGEETGELLALLSRRTKSDLLSYGRSLGLKSLTALRKDELVSVIADALTDPNEQFSSFLANCADPLFSRLHEIVQAGGHLTIPLSKAVAEHPSVLAGEPYSFMFLKPDAISLVMPDELVPLCAAADWDGAQRARAVQQAAIRYAEYYADRCGIVTIDEVFEHFAADAPEAYTREQFIYHLLIGSLAQNALYAFWDDDDQDYLIAIEFGIDLLYGDEETVNDAEGVLCYLLEEQEGKPFPDSTAEQRACGIYKSFLRHPAALEFRDYLDAHVPDTENDFHFADSLLEGVFHRARAGYPMEGFLEFFAERGLWAALLEDETDEADAANELLQLFSAARNALPIWENKGWSPSDLTEKMLGSSAPGLSAARHPAAGHKKPGRNDPCSCGSGKKYKRCCGS